MPSLASTGNKMKWREKEHMISLDVIFTKLRWHCQVYKDAHCQFDFNYIIFFNLFFFCYQDIKITMSHHNKDKYSQIAHAEAALGAGRKYENPSEGQNQMYDNFQDLVKENERQYGHSSNQESRGTRIDRELEQEDKETIERMNEQQAQREERKQEQHRHRND
jgi:hypothetical protein